jgi:hypothetical protein
MATITLKRAQRPTFTGAAPYGNLSVQAFPLQTNATGAPVNADSSAPLAIGDIVDLGPLQAGLRLEDATVFVKTGLTTGVTASLGFVYDDGVDDPNVPQNAAYFGTGIALAAVAKIRATGASLAVLPKPARLIATLAGAANAKVGDVTVLVYGEQLGPR